MTQLVKVPVISALLFAILLRRDDSFCADALCKGDDLIRIVPTVGKQILRSKTFYQLRCNCAIRSGTRCNKESYWHTMRIHGQMYLGVEPPFVRSMSWLPPTAPVACG